MSNARSERVVIVGGGLAGASAACILGQAGHRALLLERDQEPRHKICGEFLSIEAQAYLAHLGLDLDRLGASRVSRLRLIHRRDLAEADLPFMARGLSRKALDEALLQRALSHGVRIERGMTVRSIAADGAAIGIDMGRHGEIHAETLFLATGKHEVRGAKRPIAGSMNDLIGFKAHYRLSEGLRRALEGMIEIVLFAGGYAGLQLIEDGTANLCLVVNRQRFEDIGRSWQRLLAGIAEECPLLSERLQGATPLFERPLAIFQIPYGFLHRPGAEEPQGLFRLGDQMGVIPSFTGEGISVALHSGCLAASTFLRHGRASTVFHHQMASDIRRQIQIAFVLNKAARQVSGQRILHHLCRTWPAVMRQVAALTRMREPALRRALAAP